VVADDLSRRSHVSQLVVDSMSFELCEDIDKECCDIKEGFVCRTSRG
jgi:hypothetical protein